MNFPILVTRGSFFILNMAPAISFCSLSSARRSSASLYVRAELPHAEGSQTTVGTGAANADLTIEGAALALQADERRQYQAGNRDYDEHGTAEHDVEHALDGPVGQARAVPVHDGLRGLVTAGALAPVHGLGNQCRPRRRTALCCFFSSHSQNYTPVPQGSPNR